MQLIDQIIALEESLHTSTQKRNNQIWLQSILHPEFREITQSGYLVDREEVIESLLHAVSALDYHGYDYQLMHVTDSCVILIYKTIMSDHSIVALRTSHWVLNVLGEWQLIFHQGTLFK